MEQDLRIYAQGLAFSGGVYDLRTLENLISSYRKILDGLVAVQLGRRQITPNIKKQLDYNVSINQGSIELLLNFVLDHKEVLGIFAADGGQVLSETIVTLFKNAIELREKASSLIDKGLSININIVNSFNAGSRFDSPNVSYDNNKGTILINDPKILWAAQLTRGPVNKLLSQIDGSSVEYISLSTESSEFRLTPDQRAIMGNQKEELKATLNIVGRLDVVAFSSHKGTIISDNEKFSVTWNESIRPKMQRVADREGIIFRVNPVVDHMRLDSQTIGFHILDCTDPQQKLEI
jgi:hypothetical protein